MKQLPPDALSAFCTELAMIIETGIPIADGILMLIDDEEDRKIKQFLNCLYENMEHCSFSEAAANCGAFPKYAQSMFVVGEKTGRLDSVLRSLSAYYERDVKIRDNIRNAVAFPLILFALLMGVMWVLLTQVLPVFEAAFTQLGITLDSTAGTLMQIGIAIEGASLALLFAIVSVVVIALAISQTRELREKSKALASQLFGKSALFVSLAEARFSASMAMTLKSGLDLDESLELALKFAPTKRSAAQIQSCREGIAEGKTFNEAILETRILSPLHCRMLALSFKTGTTDEIMELIAQKSEENAGHAISSLVGRIEPAMAFIVSVLIGLILLSVMFPLLAVMG